MPIATLFDDKKEDDDDQDDRNELYTGGNRRGGGGSGLAVIIIVVRCIGAVAKRSVAKFGCGEAHISRLHGGRQNDSKQLSRAGTGDTALP